MKLGKASYGSGKKTYFKLKEGDSVFRILPPLGKDENDPVYKEGIWSVYYKIVYGYTNTAGKSRAFESSLVENYKTKMVEVPDASIERLEKLKSSLEAAKSKGDKKAVEALQKLVGAPKSRYNLDKNHYLNAIDLQGNIGILKLRHKAKQALDVQIRKLRDNGCDPLSSEDGRFFVFTRTGMGNETQFAVSIYETTSIIDKVGKVKQEVVSTLSEDVIGRLKNEAGKLKELFKKPTAAQIQQIVNESDLATGVSPNIDDILGYKTDESTAAATDVGDDDGDNYADLAQAEEATPTVVKTAPVESAPIEAAPVAVTPTPAPTAKVETKQAAAPAVKRTTPTTTAEKVEDMSDDEFLKSLNL